MRRARVLTGIAALLLLAGCGAEDGGGDGGAPAEPGTSLHVSSWAAAREGEGVEWDLECGPAGGSHPQAEEACALLEGLEEDAFAPVPDDVACTQIYGGPEEASVQGEWRGEPVEAQFNRTNGCEISRWDALVPLLPAPGA